MNLKEARNNKKLSQEGIARKIGISLKHYQDIEKGVSFPSVIIALAICAVFEIDPKDVGEWGDWKKRIKKRED